jgi:hypothetical protein
MFTFSDTFVPATDYVREREHEAWVAALDATEHDWTPNPADYSPEGEWEATLMDLTPEHDDDSNYVIANHYGGI